MLPFSYRRDYSLTMPVLIVTIHPTFTMGVIFPVLDAITEQVEAVGEPFYYTSIINIDHTIFDYEALVKVKPYFEDGAMLANPNLQGTVLINGRGMVQVLQDFVRRRTIYRKPLAEAASLPEAMAIIQRWIEERGDA